MLVLRTGGGSVSVGKNGLGARHFAANGHGFCIPPQDVFCGFPNIYFHNIINQQTVTK